MADPLPPIGFWSYTRSDDTSSGKRLSELRRALADELQLLIGRRLTVKIFQDQEMIRYGADWKQEIETALGASSFLIPIVTPAFLESEMCCLEVRRFRDREQALGRGDLIFPLHYIDITHIDATEVHDPVVLALLKQHQRFDFWRLRHRSLEAEDVKTAIEALATSIRDALRRGFATAPSQPAVPAATTASDPIMTPAEALATSIRDALRRGFATAPARPAVPAATTASDPIMTPALSPPPGPALARPAIIVDPSSGAIIQEGPGPEMVLIPAGSFMMGSPDTEAERFPDEGPVHRVKIARPFWLGRYPVTRGEYATFAAETGRSNEPWSRPAFPQDDRHPVMNVSHRDAEAYVNWLSRETGEEYRLPGEAEWEYAARAGTQMARYWGEAAGRPGEHARFSEQFGSVGGMYLVGSFAPNGFGLYDMLGNVWEWCADHWHDNHSGAPTDGSAWLDSGSAAGSASHMLRGGSWNYDARNVRSAVRTGCDPSVRFDDVGFRCARVRH